MADDRELNEKENKVAQEVVENAALMGILGDLKRYSEISNGKSTKDTDKQKTVTSKPEEVKAEPSKKEAVKKVTSKKETQKRVIRKIEVPKIETPKKEVPKKETPKKEIPKKEVPKKETPKKEVPKKEVPKKETLKKETPKKEISKTPEKTVIAKKKKKIARPAEQEEIEIFQDEEIERKKIPAALVTVILIFSALIISALVIVFGFRLKTVDVVGNNRISKEEINAIIGSENCMDNTLWLWIKNRKINYSDNDIIADINVEITDMNTITVRVKEQILVGCIKSGSDYLFINSEGNIIMQDTSNSEKLMMIDGLSEVTAEDGCVNSTDTQNLKTALLIADLLEFYGVSPESLTVESDNTFTLKMKDVTILLGRGKDMESKISELSNLVSELSGMKGTLHLESYDSTKDTITFTKD